MRTLFFSLIYLTGVLTASAQQYTFLNERSSRMDFFNHLDASVTLGTTGIGFDLATPVGDYVQLRAGYAFMPRFHHSMHFDVQVGDTKESKYDADGNRVQTKFDKMAALLEDFSGYKAQDEVEVIGRPTYNNLKVMVDVFPFQSDRRWHITAGFFWGPSKIADAYNVTEAMPSLFAVSMYNRLYDKTMASYDVLMKVGKEINPETGQTYQIYDVPPIFSVGQYELNSPTEIKYLYEIADVMPSFLEDRGFHPILSTNPEEMRSDKLSEASRPYFRDYVKTPRPTGYRSLHITFHDDMARCYTELQLRTKDMDDYAEIGEANHFGYEKGQEENRARRDIIREGECRYFDEAYVRLMQLHSLDLSKVNVNMFTAYSNQLINDGCGLFRGRQILPYEHLSRFQNDLID